MAKRKPTTWFYVPGLLRPNRAALPAALRAELGDAELHWLGAADGPAGISGQVLSTAEDLPERPKRGDFAYDPKRQAWTDTGRGWWTGRPKRK